MYSIEFSLALIMDGDGVFRVSQSYSTLARPDTLRESCANGATLYIKLLVVQKITQPLVYNKASIVVR